MLQMPKVRLNELDSALHELGMLATCTNSRQEYLREIQNRQVLNMLTINTRYVSNVSIGFRVRPVTPHVRYKPYSMPKREERHRTKSENNDANESTNLIKSILEDKVSSTLDELSNLKKAKSLESVVLENTSNISLGHINIPEVEVVSSCIEKLKVHE